MKSERWIAIARLGFAARALVYFLIGWLTLHAALHGGRPSSNVDAMASLQPKPYGHPLLFVVAFGLAVYAAWRFAQAWFDPDCAGREAKGVAKRIGRLFSGATHVGFAYYAVRLGLGEHTGTGNSADAWSVWLLHKPAGQVLLAIVAIGLVIAAVDQFRHAWTCCFTDDLDPATPAPNGVRWIGRLGYSARGVVFVIAAWMLARAAWQSRGTEAGGMREAFERLREAEHGPLLLAIVASGFCLFGLFCAIQARFQRLRIG